MEDAQQPPAPPPQEAAPPPPPTASSQAPSAPITVALPKSPRAAVILSAFPGLGNVYNGLYLRGITFFVLFWALIQMASRGDEIWIPAAMFVWFFNVLDAYRQARLINLGAATDLGLLDKPEPAGVGQGGLLAGAVIFLLGLVAFLDIQLGLDIDWVLDFWPVGLMALGGWFIWTGMRSRKTPPSPSEDELLGPDAL